MDVTTWNVLIVAFFATLIRSTFGFGEALVAVPLLALTMPIRVAVPVAVLLSITIAAVVIVQDWRKIHVSSAGWLLASTFLGIPIGIELLTMGHQSVVKAVLGFSTFLFGFYFSTRKRLPELSSDSKVGLLVSGFIAGILGGAYGINGPPLVIYGTMRRWSPQHFRATLQGYFLPASLVGMAGYWLSGLWAPEVTHYYLVATTVAVPTIFLGRWLNHRLTGDSFLKYVHYGLAGIGIILMVQSLK